MSNKVAFVIMPFSDEFSEIYEHLIRNTLQNAGYTVKRADDIKSQNNIIGNIIISIVNCDIIVADLTGSNPNVYYELGIAHSFNKKVILITQDIGELPFDLRSYRVVNYSPHFSKMIQAENELSELALEAFNETLPFGNPVKDFINTTSSSNIIENIELSNKNAITSENLGIIDYRIMLENGFEGLTCLMSEIADKLVNELNPKITESNDKLASGKNDTKKQRDIFRKLAEHIQEYGAFLRPRNMEYKRLLKDIETSLEYMFSGNSKLEIDEAEQELRNFIGILSKIEESALACQQGCVSYIATIESLPKFENDFNNANEFMVAELKTFVSIIDRTISVTGRSGRLGRNLLEK